MFGLDTSSFNIRSDWCKTNIRRPVEVWSVEGQLLICFPNKAWIKICLRFSNLGSRHHLSVAPNDCEGRSGAWEGRLCVDYRPRPQERAALDFDICQTKPGPWDFYPCMLGSYNCVNTRYSTLPPHKKKVLVTGIDRGQYGLLLVGQVP